MTTILLLSAAYLNGGAYIDAGKEVPVGDGNGEMTAERAAGMVAARLAEEVPDADPTDGDVGTDAAAQKPAARGK